MESFEEKAIKIKLTIDKYLINFNNTFKMLFLIEKMDVRSPKNLCKMLGMAKSNLAILASKLKSEKYIYQTKINKKEIEYFLSVQGKQILEQKLSLINIIEEDKRYIKNAIHD